jgi:hypothetical protein
VPDRRPPARTRRARAGSSASGPARLSGEHAISTGTASLVPDRDDPGGWFVVVNGAEASYVHLDDPTRLVFEYVRWIGDVLDVLDEAHPVDADRPPAAPLRVAHLGGAGCTLPRYVAATRPGSRQVVFEIDATLVELVREAFGIRRDDGIRLRVADARAGVATLVDASQDVVVRDVFSGVEVPRHLTTAEFAADIGRVLSPDGLYIANVADRTEQRHARAEAATLRTVFRHVALVAEPSQLRGRRYGNVVVLASDAPLPLDPLTRRLASGAVRARVVRPDRVAELVAGLHPLADAAASGTGAGTRADDGDEEDADPRYRWT